MRKYEVEEGRLWRGPARSDAAGAAGRGEADEGDTRVTWTAVGENRTQTKCFTLQTSPVHLLQARLQRWFLPVSIELARHSGRKSCTHAWYLLVKKDNRATWIDWIRQPLASFLCGTDVLLRLAVMGSSRVSPPTQVTLYADKFQQDYTLPCIYFLAFKLLNCLQWHIGIWYLSTFQILVAINSFSRMIILRALNLAFFLLSCFFFLNDECKTAKKGNVQISFNNPPVMKWVSKAVFFSYFYLKLCYC